ncbi:collagen alpha-1(X) chain-like [Ruditapes philippinarum]|uniref:collagen alpha-1(X) chain-like n=1 Tax=Ruditapes philippinarum TaxID=129788 RepID=UPI00295C225A|nr:collagen alpha-1(X) chain-like [Ruditapes philippinarum]
MACYNSVRAFVFLTIVFYPTASEPDIEPECSKFKYDKQMLETMVRMEAKMNQWDKEKENFEENMLSIMEHRKEEMKREFLNQKQQIGQMFDDYKKIREELKAAQREKLDGNFTKIPKVAFNARTKYSRAVYVVSQTMVFPEVTLNEGGGYDKITGIFTAPLAGLYQFSVHICHATTKYVVVAIVHKDTEVAMTTGYEKDTSSCSSAMALVNMETGDRVYVKVTYPSALYADKYRWPSFSGVLLNI